MAQSSPARLWKRNLKGYLEVWGTMKGLSIKQLGPQHTQATLGRHPRVALAVADQLTLITMTLTADQLRGPPGARLRVLPASATYLNPLTDTPTPKEAVAAAVAISGGKQNWQRYTALPMPKLKFLLQQHLTHKVHAQLLPPYQTSRSNRRPLSWSRQKQKPSQLRN
jgi:hypothetical protein